MNFRFPKSPILALLCFLLVGPIKMAVATTIEVRPDLARIFAAEEITGAFVLFDPARNHLTLVNPERAATPGIPASTFKIANSLIALETGVVRDENEIIPYGGKPQHIKAWERDMSMREAIPVSNLAIYQELARRIGADLYRHWLARLDYGNAEVGETIDSFWINGPLLISPVEQAQFLARLAARDLPAARENQEIVADMIKLEQRASRTLYGKTGWTITPTPHLGWFVGWVETERGVFSFALNMDIRSKRDAKKRKSLARMFLDKLDIF